jgi:hypothetical protein
VPVWRHSDLELLLVKSKILDADAPARIFDYAVPKDKVTSKASFGHLENLCRIGSGRPTSDGSVVGGTAKTVRCVTGIGTWRTHYIDGGGSIQRVGMPTS